MKRLFSAVVLVVLPWIAVAQDRALHGEPGVQSGKQIPAFSLPDQHGKVQTLSSLRGPKGLMLVFFRSADW